MSLNIICGAPCSGKSTYIQTNAQRGDLTIDVEKISKAISFDCEDGHFVTPEIKSVAIAARMAAVKRAIAIYQGNKNFNIWIIQTDPSNEELDAYKFLKANIVFLNPGKDVCLKRAKNTRDPKMIQIIDKWFSKWENK